MKGRMVSSHRNNEHARRGWKNKCPAGQCVEAIKRHIDKNLMKFSSPDLIGLSSLGFP